jgi:hypothetical protein
MAEKIEGDRLTAFADLTSLAEDLEFAGKAFERSMPLDDGGLDYRSLWEAQTDVADPATSVRRMKKMMGLFVVLAAVVSCGGDGGSKTLGSSSTSSNAAASSGEASAAFDVSTFCTAADHASVLASPKFKIIGASDGAHTDFEAARQQRLGELDRLIGLEAGDQHFIDSAPADLRSQISDVVTETHSELTAERAYYQDLGVVTADFPDYTNSLSSSSPISAEFDTVLQRVQSLCPSATSS